MAKSQEDGITILLGLKDYKVEQVREDEDRVVVKVTLERREKKCPYCDLTRLYRHGKCKPREVLHSWSNGRRVYLELHRHRWQCCDCGHTFTAGKELVQPRSRLTRQAETEALWQLNARSFSQVTRELRVSYGTLRHLLEREINEEALGLLNPTELIRL